MFSASATPHPATCVAASAAASPLQPGASPALRSCAGLCHQPPFLSGRGSNMMGRGRAASLSLSISRNLSLALASSPSSLLARAVGDATAPLCATPALTASCGSSTGFPAVQWARPGHAPSPSSPWGSSSGSSARPASCAAHGGSSSSSGSDSLGTLLRASPEAVPATSEAGRGAAGSSSGGVGRMGQQEGSSLGGRLGRSSGMGPGNPVRGPLRAAVPSSDMGPTSPSGSPYAYAGSPVGSFSPGVTPPVFVEYTMYKGKGALAVKPIKPTFRMLDSGAYALAREGTLFLTFAHCTGTRVYDWSRKQIFALSVAEMGRLIALDAGGREEFYHDPNMNNARDRGKVAKVLRVEPMKELSAGFYFNLNVRSEIEGINEHFGVPLSLAEFVVLQNVMNFIIPYCLGLHVFVHPQTLVGSMVSAQEGSSRGAPPPAPFSYAPSSSYDR